MLDQYTDSQLMMALAMIAGGAWALVQLWLTPKGGRKDALLENPRIYVHIIVMVLMIAMLLLGFGAAPAVIARQ